MNSRESKINGISIICKTTLYWLPTAVIYMCICEQNNDKAQAQYAEEAIPWCTASHQKDQWQQKWQKYITIKAKVSYAYFLAINIGATESCHKEVHERKIIIINCDELQPYINLHLTLTSNKANGSSFYQGY